MISKWEKLLQKLHNKPAEMQFEEMRKILLSLDMKSGNQKEEAAITISENKEACL